MIPGESDALIRSKKHIDKKKVRIGRRGHRGRRGLTGPQGTSQLEQQGLRASQGRLETPDLQGQQERLDPLALTLVQLDQQGRQDRLEAQVPQDQWDQQG